MSLCAARTTWNQSDGLHEQVSADGTSHRIFHWIVLVVVLLGAVRGVRAHVASVRNTGTGTARSGLYAPSLVARFLCGHEEHERVGHSGPVSHDDVCAAESQLIAVT